MNKKSAFIDYVEKMIEITKDSVPIPSDAAIYWEAFREKETTEKSEFTDNGKIILKFMQDSMPMGKAKDIGEGIGLSSRTVSGGIRKLVSDGYVEKIGQDPVVYSITDKGKSVEII